MAYTKAQLINLAAQSIGVLGDGETLSAESSDVIGNALTNAHADLDQHNLKVWDVETSTPNEYADSFVRYAAWRYAGFFEENVPNALASERVWLNKLKQTIDARRNSDVHKNEYF